LNQPRINNKSSALCLVTEPVEVLPSAFCYISNQPSALCLVTEPVEVLPSAFCYIIIIQVHIELSSNQDSQSRFQGRGCFYFRARIAGKQLQGSVLRHKCISNKPSATRLLLHFDAKTFSFLDEKFVKYGEAIVAKPQ
jgi:hypothetical protein